VIAAVYGVWSVGLQAWRHGEDATAMFQRQRIVLETLSELTKSVVYFDSNPSIYRLYGQHNEPKATRSRCDGVGRVVATERDVHGGNAPRHDLMSQDQFGRPVLAIANTRLGNR